MTEDKDSICCSWYESCTYYMQCEHLYNENKDLSEDVYRLEQENKELKEQAQLDGECIDKLIEARDMYAKALEEIREKAQHCITQDVCALCDYSKECAVPDADGLVYDNNRLLIKLINEVLQ